MSESNQSANWVCDTPMGSWSTTLAANCFTCSQLAAPRLPDESRMKTRSRGNVEQGVVVGIFVLVLVVDDVDVRVKVLVDDVVNVTVAVVVRVLVDDDVNVELDVLLEVDVDVPVLVDELLDVTVRLPVLVDDVVDVLVLVDVLDDDDVNVPVVVEVIEMLVVDVLVLVIVFVLVLVVVVMHPADVAISDTSCASSSIVKFVVNTCVAVGLLPITFSS